MKGLGYQPHRIIRKNLIGNNGIEKKGTEDYCVYFGRPHLDSTVGKLLKIGRGKFATAIQRGRNQPGIDFRIYALIHLKNNADTFKMEKWIKAKWKKDREIGSQGQRELYNFTDRDIPRLIKELENSGIEIIAVNLYLNNDNT